MDHLPSTLDDLLAPAAQTFLAKKPEPCSRAETCRTAPNYVIPIGHHYQLVKDLTGHGLAIVCNPCWIHIDTKKGTELVTERRHRQPLAHGPEDLNDLRPNPSLIRRMNHQAKRQISVGGSHVQAIGSLSTFRGVTPLHGSSAGVDAHRQSRPQTGSAARGYTSQHRHYDAQFRQRSKVVYAPILPEVISIKFSVHHFEEGKAGSKVFMHIEDRQDVPAKSTSVELKQTLLSLAQRQLMDNTFGFIFYQHDFIFRGQDGTNYDRFPPTEPLFYELCFGPGCGKAKGGPPVFQSGKSFAVKLILQPEVYDRVLLHMERALNRLSTTAITPTSGSAAIGGRKRPRSIQTLQMTSSLPSPPAAKRFQAVRSRDDDGETQHILESASHTSTGVRQLDGLSGGAPPAGATATSTTRKNPSNQLADCSIASLDPEKIRAALIDSAAAIDTGKRPNGIFHDTGVFIAAPVLDFSVLVEDKYKFVVDWDNEGCTAHIAVDERPIAALGQPGSFKTAHPGRIVVFESSNKGHPEQQAVFFRLNSRVDVAVKRWYQPASSKAEPLVKTGKLDYGNLIRVGKAEEEKLLAGEITCL
ncbi:hypothetical protein CALVIDRAFT_529814, partial [Calocera viscosa TUFC12733]